MTSAPTDDAISATKKLDDIRQHLTIDEWIILRAFDPKMKRGEKVERIVSIRPQFSAPGAQGKRKTNEHTMMRDRQEGANRLDDHYPITKIPSPTQKSSKRVREAIRKALSEATGHGYEEEGYPVVLDPTSSFLRAADKHRANGKKSIVKDLVKHVIAPKLLPSFKHITKDPDSSHVLKNLTDKFREYIGTGPGDELVTGIIRALSNPTSGGFEQSSNPILGLISKLVSGFTSFLGLGKYHGRKRT